MEDRALVHLWFIVGTVFAGSIVLVPLVSLGIRFALKPLLEMYVRVRSAQSPESELQERRISLLEAEVQALRHTVSQLEEAEDFRRPLAGPPE